jgi:hypothetical protein
MPIASGGTTLDSLFIRFSYSKELWGFSVWTLTASEPEIEEVSEQSRPPLTLVACDALAPALGQRNAILAVLRLELLREWQTRE